MLISLPSVSRSTRLLLLLSALFFTVNVHAQNGPPNAPRGAYANYFRYYAPGDANMPAGSVYVSKGLAMITNKDYRSMSNDEEDYGSAFIVQTFRDDDTICVCTAGHVAKAVFNDDNPYAANPPYNVNPFNLYLGYLGRSNSHDTALNELVSGYKTPIPITAKLVRYIEDSTATDSDIALFLVDRKQLPAVANYAQIGYDLRSLYGKASNTIGRFYQIGHPHAMPQKITLDAGFTPGTVQKPHLLSSTPLTLPIGTGPGASGSPWLIRTQANGMVSNTGTAIAINSFGYAAATTLQPLPVDLPMGAIFYDTDIEATELAAIAADIKAHCWKNKTEAQLELTKEYMNTVIVYNNILPYSQSQTISQVSDLTAITAPNAYTVNEGSGTSMVSATYLKAATCTIGSPSFPAMYSSTGKPWQINIMGKEVNIIPPSGSTFEYTANGNAGFNIGATLVESTTQAIAGNVQILPNNTATNDKESADGIFAVWPNPSTTGKFLLAVPTAKTKEHYEVIIYDYTGGQKIAQGSIAPGTTYPIDLSAYAKGIYIASFYKNRKAVHTAKLVYR